MCVCQVEVPNFKKELANHSSLFKEPSTVNMVNYRRPVSKRVFVKSRKTGKDVRRATRTTRTIKSSTTSLAVQGNNPKNVLVHRGVGFPDSYKTTLVYADSIFLTPSAGVITPSKGYRMASLYDPELPVGGAQPYWFDTLMAIYGRFKVLGAKMTCVFAYTNVTAADIGPTIVGIQTGEISGLATTNGSVLRSSTNTSTDLLTTQSEPKTVVATYSPNTSFGGILMDALTGSVSADPARGWQALVFASPQGVNLTQPINVLVTIEYFAEFTQLVPNAGS